MQETAESSGGTHQHNQGGPGFFSGRVKNKITAELDDIVFGQSLGEGKTSFLNRDLCEKAPWVFA